MYNSNLLNNNTDNIEEFRNQNQERGISSINTISKGNIPSRISSNKNIVGNYKLSNTPPQFIKPNQQQFIKPNQQQFIKPNQQQLMKPNQQQLMKPNQQQFMKPNQQQFIKPNQQQLMKSNQQQFMKPNSKKKSSLKKPVQNTKKNNINHKRKNRYNFPKLDKLSINHPNYRRYFSYPYYYDYYYNPYLNQNILWDDYPVINTANYYLPYENEDYLIPAERYYKGEIRTDFGGEKDESEIIEAEEFDENDDNYKNDNYKNDNYENDNLDIEEDFNLIDINSNSMFYLFLIVAIVLLFLLK
jgi:hypothetical protein